jgi:carboxypeptidase C (cathepsin A)
VRAQQPIRVGFSQAAAHAPDITSEKQVAHDMRAFLTSFLITFPELAELEVYISGESYAGFYIPWIADHIVRTQTSLDYSRRSSRTGTLQ